MKNIQLTSILSLFFAVLVITDCNSYNVSNPNEGLRTASESLYPTRLSSSAELYQSLQSVGTERNDNTVHIRSISTFAEPLFRPGASSLAEGNIGKTDDQENRKHANFLSAFVLLMDDPEVELEEVEDYLDEHTDQIVSCSYLGSKALHYLAGKGEDRILRHLLKASGLTPDVSCEPSQITALQHAALGGHLEVVQYLLEAGANINHRDIQGNSVVFYAATGGSIEVVKHLMKTGADMAPETNTECKGLNLLHIAIIHNGQDFVISLLDLMQNQGVDIRAMASKRTDLKDHASPLSLADQIYGKGNRVSSRLKNEIDPGFIEMQEEKAPKKRPRLINGQG
ncbi:MAG: ankyrin repeat domain-containing protein [Bacteroidota bacterium]